MVQSFAALEMKAQLIFRRPRKAGDLPFFKDFLCFTQ
jgi:hypothetical protein